MSYAGLGTAVALLAYGAVNLLGTTLVAAFLLRAVRVSDPAARARRLVLLRVLPTASALLVVGGMVVPAFLWLEPRNTSEEVSGVMAALAGIGLLMLVVGPARGLASVLSTRRLLQRWERTKVSLSVPGTTIPAMVVDEPFPLVSLVGWFRPRLVVAQSVLSSCDRDEIAAVLAHEAGHNERRDPWVRLVMRACPDALSLTPWADRIERLWAEAAEQDADERAARTGPTRAMDLASALVKVARLARSGNPPADAVAALYRGSGVAARVTRLLEREPGEAVPSAGTGTRVAVIAVLSFLLVVPLSASLDLHRGVHRVQEAVVSFFQ